MFAAQLRLPRLSAKTIIALIAFYAAVPLALGFFFTQKAAAACPPPATDYGKATFTVNVPSTATYRVWSRMQAPNTTANSYALNIDGTTCNIVVGDNATMPVNAWTWVSYKNGTTNSFVDVSLTAGNHTIEAVGREAEVKLDRVILTSDLACVPDNTLNATHQPGDNCAPPPDTVSPAVAIASPTNGASVSTTTNVVANSFDNVGVKQVEFFIDGQKFGTDTSATNFEYSASLNPANYSAGTHTLTARSCDSSDNCSTSTSVSITNHYEPSQWLHRSRYHIVYSQCQRQRCRKTR
jgi:hypothetical protein